MKQTLLLLLFLMVAVAGLRGQSPRAKLYVLSVGVSKYADTGLNLNYADDDARDLAAAWQKQTSLYDVVAVRVLTDADATRANIHDELDRFKGIVSPNDLFVFTFSGQGIVNALLPHDFQQEDINGTALSKDDLFSKLASLGCNYFVFLDATNSGSFTKSVDGKDLNEGDTLSVEQAAQEPADSLAATGRKSVVLSSCSPDQKSFECPPCQNGYFTQAFLDALEGKEYFDPKDQRGHRPDQDANGFLSVLELKRYLSRVVHIKTEYKFQPQKVCILYYAAYDLNLLRPAGTVPLPPLSESDRDGDGILDHVDRCPDDPGEMLLEGCAPPTIFPGKRDSDGDGVIDYFDNCIDLPGPARFEGCPIIATDTQSLTITVNGVSFVMKKVVASTFKMGCTLEQHNDCYDREKPIHRVTLTNDYYLGETEVTQALWRAVMDIDPPELGFSGCDECPVESVSWDDVQIFLQKLNIMTDHSYRLPTEAEWEHAARGGLRSKRYKYSGSNDIDAVAWHDRNADGKTHPVKGKAPNELGLYDMSGSVVEWCQDWYSAYSSTEQTNPTGPESGNGRVLRGGDWISYLRYCRVTSRQGRAPHTRSNAVGFRLAVTH